jgi:hypothetical protein
MIGLGNKWSICHKIKISAMWDKRFSSGFNLRIYIKNRNKRERERKRGKKENNRIGKKNDDGDDDDKCLFVCRLLALLMLSFSLIDR